jgi:hypothetical protein
MKKNNILNRMTNGILLRRNSILFPADFKVAFISINLCDLLIKKLILRLRQQLGEFSIRRDASTAFRMFLFLLYIIGS